MVSDKINIDGAVSRAESRGAISAVRGGFNGATGGWSCPLCHGAKKEKREMKWRRKRRKKMGAGEGRR